MPVGKKVKLNPIRYSNHSTVMLTYTNLIECMTFHREI